MPRDKDKPVFQFEPQSLEPELNQQQLARDVFGLFQTISAVPTDTPKTWFDQIRIYKNSTTLRLYWYDPVEGAWHYVTATA